jgi:SWI/SNF-related matrix-associated actin-dependent regulator of chromatin subfamily A3
VNKLTVELHGMHSSMSHVPAIMHRNGQLSVDGDLDVGYLDTKSAEVMKVLLEDDVIETQVFLSSPTAPISGKRNSANCRETGSASVIIYGPIDLFEDIGSFFQACGLYLQDPVGCDRNVQYCNPHRLSAPDAQMQLTFDLGLMSRDVSVRQLQDIDSLDQFISSKDLPEMDTPHLLRTQLLPYSPPLLLFLVYKLTFAKASEASTVLHDPTRGRMEL